MTKGHELLSVMDAQARKTALIVAGVLILIAGWQYYRGRLIAATVVCGVGAGLIVIGMFFPTVAQAFHKCWMRLAVTLGWINSRILLGLMFYGVFTPYRLIGRLVRRDPLSRRGAPGRTYWIARKSTRQTREQFERTF